MTDIVKQLVENAHVLDAHRYTTAAQVMRDAATLIDEIRRAGTPPPDPGLPERGWVPQSLPRQAR